MTAEQDDALETELLDGALETGDVADLPERLLQLAAVAAELAGVLAAPVLSPEQRRRILARAEELTRRRTVLGIAIPRSGQLAVLAAGAGGAAVTLAVIGIALRRRSAPPAADPRQMAAAA